MRVFQKILIALGVVFLSFGVYVVYLAMTTKSHSPADTAQYSGNEIEIKVNYSRPFKKDRLIFGSEQSGALVPYGSKWRTGANEATEISLSRDVLVEGEPLPAGKYSLYSIPQENHWVVVFNKKTSFWGAGFTKDPYDEKFDVLRVRAAVSPLSEPVEQFGISLQERTDSVVVLSFAWDLTQSSLNIEI